MTRLAVSIPAKINLHLQVLGRREDGFHELRSLFSSVDLFDDLVAEPAPDGCLELQVAPSGSVENDERNLVLRAARALWEATGGRMRRWRRGLRATREKKTEEGRRGRLVRVCWPGLPLGVAI